jgi:methanogenic corrinoid protein MtbC1
VANFVHTSTVGDEQSAKQPGNQIGVAQRSARRDLKDDPCGENLDWSRGLEGLRRSVGRTSQLTGPLLTKVIEREIIPRLLLSHRDTDMPRPLGRAQRDAVSNIDSEALTQLVLSSEPADRIIDQVQALLDRGVSLQRIYLDLLAPIARRLGEFWEQDRCTFVDMTIALSRLHWVLREVGRRNSELINHVPLKGRVYLVPSPGEQHTLGLLMIEEFFLHAGWEMASDSSASLASIRHTLSIQHVDLVGLSVSCVEYFEPLLQMIKHVQDVSVNRDIKVMVGGRLFRDQPEFVDKVTGATVVVDATSAVPAAERLISPPSRLESIEQPT